jgi:RecA/RadA recombinase
MVAKFDLSVVRKQINDALDKEAVRAGNEVVYVDVKNPEHFVVMPEWFQQMSTIPGLPFGYIVEFVGLPNAGKTTAGMIALIEAQKQGHVTILIDVEKKFSYDRFVLMGGKREDLIVISEPTIEENFNVLETTQKAINQEYPAAKIIVVYDSIAVGSTRADMAKTTLDAQVMADQAKVIKRMLRRQVVLCAETNCVFVAINQMYGNPNPAAHGAPSMAGGKGLEYAKALSITFKKAGKLPPTTRAGIKYERGIITKILTTKNHLQQGELSLTEVLLHVTADAMTVANLDKKGKKAKVDGEEVAIEFEKDEGGGDMPAFE